MASTRLRKAFKYPEDVVTDEARTEDLDEEEQEKLIEDLKEYDRQSTKFWQTPITVLVLAIATFYSTLSVYMQFKYFSTPQKNVALAGVCASVCSAIFVQGIPQAARNGLPELCQRVERTVPGAPFLTFVDAACLAVHFCFVMITIAASSDMRLAAPGLVAIAVALLGRYTLQPVMSIQELERLRYNYKGA